MKAKAFDLKSLDRDTLGRVYRDHLTPEFPPSERRPLASMEKLIQSGHYEALGLWLGEELWAYAMLWHDPEGDFYLLDYLAVCRDQARGAGTGAAMLKGILARYSRGHGILAEAERQEPRASEAENALRERRLVFYRREGFQELGYTAHIFGVRYAMLLWGEGEEGAAMAAHQRLYHSAFNPWVYRRFIHIPEKE